MPDFITFELRLSWEQAQSFRNFLSDLTKARPMSAQDRRTCNALIDTLDALEAPLCAICDHLEELHGPFNLQHKSMPKVDR